MTISLHEIVEACKKVGISEDRQTALVEELTKFICQHNAEVSYKDIHFHRHELICSQCGKAIGFYDQYSNRKFYYPEERNLDEMQTLNMSSTKTPRDYKLTS